MAGEKNEEVFATILKLIKRTREVSNINELQFLLVNETFSLLPYRQAALWFPNKGVATLSGVSQLEKHAPYIQWLEKLFKEFKSLEIIKNFNLAKLDTLDHEVKEEWKKWLPSCVVIVPIANGGLLLLARTEEFHEDELIILNEWAEAWNNQYNLMLPRGWATGLIRHIKSDQPWYQNKTYIITFAVLLISIIPVRLSVLAAAELIPLDPAIIRAPLNGVIETVNVKPNQLVKPGDILFEFDRVSLSSQLNVAKRELATRQTEYRQEAQRSLSNTDSKANLAILQSRIREKSVEVNYLNELNERSSVASPREGIVLFGDATELIGQPVSTGERIMVVAGETEVQLEAWVSPSDLIEFSDQSELIVYLAADPLSPLPGVIKYISHQAELRPEGHFAYRVRAQLTGQGNSVPRVGLKGTAKLYGNRVPLLYWIFRKPWAAFRGWSGL